MTPTSTDGRPLVSLCITCYNQAKYIREAVQSAFDQTYDPLEIVICDDCSTDGTDKVVEEMVSDYRKNGGGHSVIFKRNEKNLYVLKNYEQAFRLAHGELLITGAGDDISHPDRAVRIVEAWEMDGRKATCLCHAWNNIDLDGHFISRGGPWRIETPLGAATAYARCVVSEFGDLPDVRDVYEDHILSARALMFGTELMIGEPLIDYRCGSGETTKVGFLEHRRRVDYHGLRSNEIILRELSDRLARIRDDRVADVRRLQDWRLGRFQPENDLVTGTSVWARWQAFRRMRSDYGWYRDDRWLNYFPLVFPSASRDFVARVVRRVYPKIARLRDHGFAGSLKWVAKKVFCGVRRRSTAGDCGGQKVEETV